VKRSVYNHSRAMASLHPAARTATANGTGVDRLQGRVYYRSAMVMVHTGAITDGTHTISVEDSADNTTFAAVADEFLQGTEPALGSADDNEVHEIGYTGSKRYLRVTATVSGATTGGIYAAAVLLGDPTKPPVAHS
jgi:hypothetical protein